MAGVEDDENITVFLAGHDTLNPSQRLQNLERPAGNLTSSEVLR